MFTKLNYYPKVTGTKSTLILTTTKIDEAVLEIYRHYRS